MHSTEEVIFKLEHWMPVVTGKIHNFIAPFPVIGFSEELFVFANILIILIFAVISWFVFKNYQWGLKPVKIFSIIEIINGSGHIIMAIIFLSYIPGCITGIGLVILGVLCLKSYKSI